MPVLPTVDSKGCRHQEAMSISEEASTHRPAEFALHGATDFAVCDWTFGEAVLVFELSAFHDKNALRFCSCGQCFGQT